MSKRFTESNKWDDPFFCELSNEYKLLWIYILDKCDHAGIYKVNSRNANFSLGHNFDWDKEVPEKLGERIVLINKEKWFIPKFVYFQYGELCDNNRVHTSIIRILQKEGVFKPLRQSVDRRKDKDKEQDKDKDKDNKGGKDFLQELKKTYDWVDVDGEIQKMELWISKNKGRRLTQKFAMNWLNKIDKPFHPKLKVLKTEPLPKIDEKELAENRAKVAQLTSATIRTM